MEADLSDLQAVWTEAIFVFLVEGAGLLMARFVAYSALSIVGRLSLSPP